MLSALVALLYLAAVAVPSIIHRTFLPITAHALGRPETALLLIASGADTTRQDRAGRTPLQCCNDTRTRNTLIDAMRG